MLTRWNDFDRTFTIMNDLQRRIDRAFGDARGYYRRPADFDPSEDVWALSAATWPRAEIHDGGSDVFVYAEIPGLAEKDVQLSIHQDVLTLSGERKTESPQGYAVQRQERLPARFQRSFSLPAKIDPEKATATLKHGVLTVKLPKVPEAQPRQIAVRAE